MDFTNTIKAKSLSTIEKHISYLKSRKDIKDLAYTVNEINCKSLRYQLIYKYNWR